MISYLLYLRAKRNPEGNFRRYLAQARDRGAWRGIVAGTFDLPRWLRPTHGPLAQNNVRILVGRPQETLLEIDDVEREAGRPIRDVWRALRGFIHEGVDFAPYAETFRKRLGAGVTYVQGDTDPACDLNAFGERLSKEAVDAAVASAREGGGGEITRYEIEAEFPTVAESRGRHVIKTHEHPVEDEVRLVVVREETDGLLELRPGGFERAGQTGGMKSRVARPAPRATHDRDVTHPPRWLRGRRPHRRRDVDHLRR